MGDTPIANIPLLGGTHRFRAEMAELRRWSYGLEDAPDNFICRNCLFAIAD